MPLTSAPRALRNHALFQFGTSGKRSSKTFDPTRFATCVLNLGITRKYDAIPQDTEDPTRKTQEGESRHLPNCLWNTHEEEPKESPGHSRDA